MGMKGCFGVGTVGSWDSGKAILAVSSTSSASSKARRRFAPKEARPSRSRRKTVASGSVSWESRERTATCQDAGSPANSALGAEIGSVCHPWG